MLSPDEVLSTLVLVIPGFIAVGIARYGWGTSRPLGDLALTSWSIFLSAAIDLFFIIASGLPLPPTAGQLVAALSTGVGLATYAAITFGFGLVGAFFLRFDATGAIRKLVWMNSETAMKPTLLWDDVLTAHYGQWIGVECTDDRVIEGRLARFSTWEEPRELYVRRPREVVFDDEGNPAFYKMGAAIVIPGTQIKTIRFLSRSVIDLRQSGLKSTSASPSRVRNGGVRE